MCEVVFPPASPRPTTASLHGVRVACFYPWIPFQSTGAWSRYSCLWRFLIEEGAEVTLAFLARGNNARLKGISVLYTGEHTIFDNTTAIDRTISTAQSMPELRNYSWEELNFPLRYEKKLYRDNPKTGPWLDTSRQNLPDSVGMRRDLPPA